MYDIAATRAERNAQRDQNGNRAFPFTLDGVVWELVDPRDLPAEWFTWQMADYYTHTDDIIRLVDAGEVTPAPDRFPKEQLTTEDLDALVTEWLRVGPGESQPPAGS